MTENFIGMTSPYHISDWYCDCLTCHTASGATVLLASKTESLGYRIQHSLHDHMFSGFSTVPACDRRTDRQTDRHIVTLLNLYALYKQLLCMYVCMYTATAYIPR